MPTYRDLGFKEKLVLFSGIEQMTEVEIPLLVPPNKNKILNFKRPVADQKFERFVLPKNFDKQPKSDKDEFINEEWRKRIEGYWFMNHGVLTYMTGLHYYYCNWWGLDFGYPEFWISDQEYFLHWDYRVKDEASYGLINIEGRRTGKSSKGACTLHEPASRKKNVNCGIQSLNDGDGKKFFKTKIVYGHKNLPYFFKPVSNSTSDPETELKFFAPADRSKEAYKVSDVSELKSMIDYQPAKKSGYDGQKLYRYVSDEAGKLSAEVQGSERWQVVKKALFDMNKGMIYGKAIHTSTVEQNSKEGIRQFKELWEESRIKDSNGNSLLKDNGQTVSGLHQHFVPAFKLMFRDKYGVADEVRARKYIEDDRKNARGESLASLKRKAPMTITEAFTVAGEECKFNSTILDMVLDQYTFGNKEVTRGNFMWRDGAKDTMVDFMPSDNGRFYVSYLFPKPEMSNAFKYEGGIKTPANTDFFIAGADPFKVDVTKDRRNSKFGFGVFRKRDWNVDNPAIVPYEVTEHGIIKHHVTERFCCTYAFRPTTLDQACEDALMACVYFGCEVFPEMNIDYFEKYMRRRGYGGYLFHKQDEVTKKYDKQAGDTTTVSVKADIYTFFSDHIERNGMREVHDDLVRDWREIGNDMEEYDRFVGCGYAGLASRKVSVTSLKGISLNEIFRPYHYK